MLVLTSELYAQVDETWRFNQLNQATKGYKLGCIHLDLSESGDQSVSQLIVSRKQAQSQSTDWIGRPGLE